jgi:glutamate-1-semialdehyde 2,1-aminomutase
MLRATTSIRREWHRWHERGAQFIYGIEPDLCTFGKGIANGFPLSALAGRREVMCLGGYVHGVDRVFLMLQTAAAEPWALAVIDTYQQEGIAEQLHRIGAGLRRNIEKVMSDTGLSSHFQLRGRDCNLVYVARDELGQPSQEFRTLVLQELLGRGVLAPSFVVSAAHDRAAIAHTVNAVAEAMPAYLQALRNGIGTVLRGRSVRPALRSRG